MEKVFGPMPHCPAEKSCLKWVQRYLLDCVCGGRDRWSLTLGFMSVASWGVAEIPQILTNFREKSTEGVSLLFLMTWVVGDVVNLLGCYLEPATLPTQFLMAILYTLTTIVLVLQVIYYYHFTSWWMKRGVQVLLSEIQQKTDMEAQKPIVIREARGRGGGDEGGLTPPASVATSIRVPQQHHHHVHGSSPGSRDQLFIQSARSLASSYAHPLGSYTVRGSTGDNVHHHGSYLLTTEDSQELLHPPPALLDSHHHRGHSRGSLPSSALRSMKRGTVEGLNPLMFVFALLGNATYVGRCGSMRPSRHFYIVPICILLLEGGRGCFIRSGVGTVQSS